MNHCKHSNKWKQDTAEKFILPINASHMVVEMAVTRFKPFKQVYCNSPHEQQAFNFYFHDKLGFEKLENASDFLPFNCSVAHNCSQEVLIFIVDERLPYSPLMIRISKIFQRS